MNVTQAVTSRRSIRAFLDKPVDMDRLRTIIETAGRAPSGGNLQPWHIHVLSGEPMARFKALMRERLAEAPFGDGAEYAVYPEPLGEPYRSRRFAVGEAMYERLGIPREDKAARIAWFKRNWQFFDAPVGLFCHVRRDHGPPQWSDCGMFLQTLMLLLREAGMDSCAQEAWAVHHKTVREFLDVPAELMLFTGMAIGWRDPDAAVNGFEVARAPMEEWARFVS
ncbi:nitroreductase [Stakelama tenebrarum]|uniref:Nitroreductase n=1 Tax=Stakelama tenebrarum TaxID=2711215 RepID=A0A6G6Y818_9SPHN|nr:nitroreductase [Sphingosinithalassobacter tenebrarum]QIG81059.1 nitroreductase [Sphingosinithalassobacter tenebrarum]